MAMTGGDATTPDGRGLLPLACTLGPDDGPARLRRWQRLYETGDPLVRTAEGVLEVSFRPGPGIRAELESLAAAERDCCAFVAWSVTDEGREAVLRVTAPPGQPGALAPVLAVFETLAPAGRAR